MDLRFRKNHAKWFVTPVMRAIRRYALIEEGDRVCVGLPGGKDSTTLLYILSYLQRYSHLKFGLSAVHVSTSPDYETTGLRGYYGVLDVPCIEVAREPPKDVATARACSICARLTRRATAQALAHRGSRQLAYGHHRHAGFPLLSFTCPSARHNIHQRYKETLRLLEESLGVRPLSRHVVRALENVDATNLWQSLRGEP